MAGSFHWPGGRSCAVSLAYDDALPIHHEYVGPRLEAHGLRGTFFLNIAASPMQNPEPWRELAARGHELGNHTLFHPCRRSFGRHPWLDKAFDLRDYTPRRLQLEVQVANAFLELLDGKSERSYANTCFDGSIGRLWRRRPISDVIRNDFVAARGERTDCPTVIAPGLDLMNIGSCKADGRTFDELRDEICAAQNQRGWLSYVFHGVGSTTQSRFIEPNDHEKLLNWLASQRQIWIRPFIEIAKWVGEWQRKP